MITLLLTLAILGFVAWLLVTYIPMAPPMKNVIVVAVVIIALLIILRAFGFSDIPLR